MKTIYHGVLALIGIGFAIFFFASMGPVFAADPDIVAAVKAGFVNPYSSGFATDAIACWAVLAAWVIYEWRDKGIKHGWIPLLLGIVPGVATGFSLYLIMRSYQLSNAQANT